MPITVGTILDGSGALLNDPSVTQFTYAKQFPYFNIAQNELQELLELNNIPVSNEVAPSSLIVTAGVVTIDSTTTPALPTDLVEIQQISERLNGSSDDYIPMTRREFLPTFIEQTESLIWWAWINQKLKFVGALTDRQLQMNYIASRLPAATTTTSPITLFNATSFLTYRTAALCAEFIGENATRAESLNTDAAAALDRFIGISTKGRQTIATRRRPFMASYKNRGY